MFTGKVSAVTVYDRNKPLAGTATGTKARFVCRRTFDNALVQKYKELGGTVFENEKGYSIDHENRKVILSDGSAVSYRYLVFADGFFSMSRELPGAGRPSAGIFGVETFIPAASLKEDSLGLHFGYVNEGYIWVYPRGDSFCVGAMGDIKKNADLKGTLLGFLDELGIDTNGLKLQSAYLPCGNAADQAKLPENILLAEDAGGFADPIFGEGLYFAMKTGMLAAMALCGNEPKKTYLESIRPITRLIKHGVGLRDQFYRPGMQKKFIDQVKGNETFLRFFFDHQFSEYDYDYNQMLKLYSDY